VDRELGQLVEKERSPMRQADLARADAAASTADERDHRRAVVGLSERRVDPECRPAVGPGCRMDLGDFECGGVIEGGEDRR